MSRELDERVAVALGWVQDDLGERPWITPDGCRPAHVPAYSTDPAEFVRLLEWAAAQGWVPVIAKRRDAEGWAVHVYPSPVQSASTVYYSDTPQLALAKAIAAAKDAP